jgi:lysophospholipase L1-like esterase
MQSRPSFSKVQNWVFLGDSLTEGVGKNRIGYVSSLVELLAQDTRTGTKYIHESRIKRVDPRSFDRFVKHNLAGYCRSVRGTGEQKELWLWNLASEGTTIQSDIGWLPFIRNLRPDLIVLYRGSLETVVRPAQLATGVPPFWLPKGWRGYASMDPRCYFSSSWLRGSKQRAIDAIKQKVRLQMLRKQEGVSLLSAKEILESYAALLRDLRSATPSIYVIGLLPISTATFVGSQVKFRELNEDLKSLAKKAGVQFFDWGRGLCMPSHEDLFFRDGFHPNEKGAKYLAMLLRDYMIDRRIFS